MQNRVGDWMQTYTGRMFWPLDPRPEDVVLEDVAHALAMLCRFGGHCLRFYSVAEHSVLVSRLVPPELSLCGLLHDATEAYVADVPRPLKRFLDNYRTAEDLVWRSVAARFGLPEVLPAEIKDADNAALLAEAEQIMASPPSLWSVPGRPALVKLQCLSPSDAERFFLDRFREIAKE